MYLNFPVKEMGKTTFVLITQIMVDKGCGLYGFGPRELRFLKRNKDLYLLQWVKVSQIRGFKLCASKVDSKLISHIPIFLEGN